ncbi:MAG: M3 family metallopeptidase, partial [Ferrovum sp.]|nr:M3 family metallopeptidase [Ferrovum sp.]
MTPDLTTNPLLDFTGLPCFGSIRTAHIRPAINRLIEECQRALKTVCDQAGDPTWDTFITPLEDANERLGRAWGQVSHLNSVVNTPELRDAYNAVLPLVAQYWALLGQNEILFNGYKALHASTTFTQLSPSRQRIVTQELRDFRLGGAELPAEDKARFLELQETLAATGARFEQNLLDATNAFTYDTSDPEELAGLPPEVLALAAETAAQAGKGGWRLTLHAPCYLPVMQYAQRRSLREHFYRCYATRAAEFGPAEWNNGPLIQTLLQLRAEAAHLLGFEHFGHLSVEPKMADSPQAVMVFLRDLAQRAKPFAQKDWENLTQFAHEKLHLTDLQPWDIAFVSEKLRTEKYDYSEQEVKAYFPEDIVLTGLFKLIERLYGLQVKPAETEVWHESVRFYGLHQTDGALVGQFYLDLHARNGKRGGAWMDDAITRRRTGDSLQLPVTYLTCNFSAPAGGKPATFTHDEVITLFHE